VTDRGGSWNAWTGSESTSYEMDIYSRFDEFAVRTLYEIITDSTISEENVELSRDIIHRESGGKPSAIRQWLRLNGIGVNGTEKAVMQLTPGTDYLCPGYETAEGITRDDILDAYRKFYVPSNMALIVVGDFSREAMLQYIRSSFGMMPKKDAPERQLKRPGAVDEYTAYTGTFSPLLANDAVVGLLYRVPDFLSNDQYPIALISEYLDFRINEILRIDRGLSYAPGTWEDALSTFGLFSISADVDLERTDEVIEILKQEMQALADAPMREEDLNRVRMKILLRNVQGYESTASFADYYAAEYPRFKAKGEYIDDESRFEAVTTADVAQVAKRYFSPDRAMVIKEAPTLTMTQFYVLVVVLLLLLSGYIVFLYVRVNRRSRRKGRR
jgi:predicted Zn-dependent peptidase